LDGRRLNNNLSGRNQGNMHEEPYRWLEAIQNRREYIVDQMRGGTPVYAVSRPEGVLLLGVGTGQSKVFEIYDRHGFCALGNPVDIEKLRQAAIEAAHTEGFQRSPEDVNLRRLVNFALSPLLKNSYESIFSPPLIVDGLFAEVGASMDEDILVRLRFDGSPHVGTDGLLVAYWDDEMTRRANVWLAEHLPEDADLGWVATYCLTAWTALAGDGVFEGLEAPANKGFEVAGKTVEAALLDRQADGPAKYRRLDLAGC
jgi:proteasome alpha subunit